MNTNIEAGKRIEELRGSPSIAKLFWIACCYENSEFDEFIRDIGYMGFNSIAPDLLTEDSYYELDESEIKFELWDAGKKGFIAEIHLPECDSFAYNDDGSPMMWSVHNGVCNVRYIYAESTNELIIEIERISSEIFQKFIEEDKLKKTKVEG
jgi:hypothetical protein